MNYKEICKIHDKVVEYIDEDTGEIIPMEVPDVEELPEVDDLIDESTDEELIAQERELANQIHELDSQISSVESEILDIKEQQAQLEIDQEEEIGQLNSLGKYAEGDALAQKYSDEMTALEDRRHKLIEELDELSDKLTALEDQYSAILDKF